MVDSWTGPKFVKHQRQLRTLALVAATFTGACSSPDLRVSCEKAILNESLKAIIINASEKPLFDVTVSVQRLGGNRQITRVLKPGESVSVGWMELSSGLRDGDVLEVRAEGFSRPFTYTCTDTDR